MSEKKLTEEFKAAFLDMLQQLPIKSQICRVMGINYKTVDRAQREDPEFDKEVRAAMEIGYDTLEAEAWRRAATGIKEPIHYKGMKVDEVNKYSDKLLMFLMKGYRPKKFNPGLKVEGGDGNKVSLSFHIGDSDE